MTDAEVADQFDIIWHGGELLPAYPSNTTLTEPCQTRVRSIAPAIRVLRHYTADQKIQIRRMYAMGNSVATISQFMHVSDNTVRSICGIRKGDTARYHGASLTTRRRAAGSAQ